MAKVIPFPLVQDEQPEPEPLIAWDKLDRLLWSDSRALDAAAVGVCIFTVTYVVARIIRAIIL
ncbi:MAG: hypothetical protein M0P69_17950 [Bacteroidales bacterium]|jgi:hypothetical protein|nr:hypothetical protein [Bacteroidales bacterium]